MSTFFNDWFISSRYGTETLNVKSFGALGNNVMNRMVDLGFASSADARLGIGGNGIAYPKCTNYLLDTADWCGIQACIDYALENNIMHVFMPEGIYKINDTIHLGYGMIAGDGNYQCIVLSGAGFADLAGFVSGTTIFAYFVNRPVINIQGGRESGVQRLKIAGTVAIPGFGATANLIARKDPANYVPAGANNNANTPFCAVCIDGYFGGSDFTDEALNNPPSIPYPTPRFPSWVFSSPANAITYAGNAYNKSASSRPFVKDCSIENFTVGIACQPWGDGNGDFLKCTGTSINSCKVGVCVGNAQARSNEFSNMIFGICHTCFDSVSYGHRIGNLMGTYFNIHVSQTYQVFNMSGGGSGPALVKEMYGEECMRLGCYDGISIWEGCAMSCHDTAITEQTLTNTTIAWAAGVATVTTSTNLSTVGWTYGTHDVRISGASAGYNTDPSAYIPATRTGTNTFTYALGDPGSSSAAVKGITTVPVITEWLQEPFFEGPGRFYNCGFVDHWIWHFTKKCEFHNVNFGGKEGMGQRSSGGCMPEGMRKAVSAFGRVFMTTAPDRYAAGSPFSGEEGGLFGPVDKGAYPEGSIANWDGYNTQERNSLWGIGQRDEVYGLLYDVPPMSRNGGVFCNPLDPVPPTNVVRTVDLAACPVGAHAQVGDVIWCRGGVWYSVESVAGTVCTIRQLTNFQLQSGTYTSLDTAIGSIRHYFPIGSLDFWPNSIYMSPGDTAGLFFKTTGPPSATAVIELVDGTGAAIGTMPSGITATSRPLWTGQNTAFYANSLPFPAHTYISSIDTGAKTITMTASALVSGTWAYGPGIKRIK